VLLRFICLMRSFVKGDFEESHAFCGARRRRKHSSSPTRTVTMPLSPKSVSKFVAACLSVLYHDHRVGLSNFVARRS
jgi:hypothetical protein